MSWGIDIELPDGQVVEIVHGHTYNLTPMWDLAGVFSTSSELHGMRARAVGALAAEGLRRAVRFPAAFRALNPANGWGDYEGFVEILTRVAIACAENPTGKVRWNG